MTLVRKIWLSNILMLFLMAVTGYAGWHALTTLQEQILYLTGPAWDTADGAMEGTIGIEAEMLAVHKISAGVELETNEKRLYAAQELTKESLSRMRHANLMPKTSLENLDRLYASHKDYLKKFLESRHQLTSSRKDFDLHTQNYLALSKEVEEVADQAVETLRAQPKQKISWDSGLAKRWESADGAMEAYIGYLRQLYYVEQLEGASDVQRVEVAIEKAQAFHRVNAQRLLDSGILSQAMDLPSHGGDSLEEVYKRGGHRHEKLMVDYIQALKSFRLVKTDYEANASLLLDLLKQTEEEGDQAVEGSDEERQKTLMNARLLIGGAFLGSLLLVLILGAALRRAFAPLADLSEGASRIASGDISGHVKVTSKDEVGALATSFNHMTDSLGTITRAQKRKVEELEGLYHVALALDNVLDQRPELNIFVNDSLTILLKHVDIDWAEIRLTALSFEGKDLVATMSLDDERECANVTEVPLFSGKKRWGALSAGMFERDEDTRELDKTLVQNMAGKLALALSQLQAYHHIGQLNRNLEDKVRARTEQLEFTMQEAQSANATKSAFLANMSHELRTPLNAIIGYSEILEEDLTDLGEAECAEDIKKIHSAGKHLLALINAVLDISKIEAGKMELYIESFELRYFIHEVEAVISPLAQTNGNHFELIGPPEGLRMSADLTKVRQILLNLLSNACKFTKQGKITLEVKISGEILKFFVRDTGIGLSREEQSKVFDAFSQADVSTTRKYGGTGLGLTICRRLATMMDGDVRVESVVGEGSTFILELPLCYQEKEGSTVELGADVTPSGRRLLVLNQDPRAPELLSELFAGEDLKIHVVSDPEEALRVALEFLPSVIALEAHLGQPEGWSLLLRIKNAPALRETPLIVIGVPNETRGDFVFGAVDYLTKPVDRKGFCEKLGHYKRKDDISRVLVVDDEEDNRSVFRSILEKEDWEVSEAMNGRSGLQVLALHKPDLIVLDLLMPEMDGFEFMHQVRTDERLRDIPVLVVSVKTLSSAERLRLQLWIQGFVERGDDASDEWLSQVHDMVVQTFTSPQVVVPDGDAPGSVGLS
jgi:signal transduction histidine kinase/DNA-binding response OmpR family regulator/HAMP domain-containing protein